MIMIDIPGNSSERCPLIDVEIWADQSQSANTKLWITKLLHFIHTKNYNYIREYRLCRVHLVPVCGGILVCHQGWASWTLSDNHHHKYGVIEEEKLRSLLLPPPQMR